jgi:hypothetical protein
LLGLLASLSFLLLPTPLPAQGYPDGFPYDAFVANEATARWIASYDRVAWVTTDSLRLLPDSARAGIGPEWLCLQDSSRWHAVYGQYDSTAQRYHVGVHYVVQDSMVRLTREPLDTAEAAVLARGLVVTLPRVRPIVPRNLMYNRYVRRLPTRQVEVWYLPAWQPNGWLIEGAELRYVLDSTAGRVVDSTVWIGRFTAWAPDTGLTIHINDRSREAAGVGPLFVLLAYGWAFKEVYIETRRFRSMLYRGPRGPAWIHALRPEGERPDSR